jgi:hypothetical protein|tara:strand:- start:543 stop:722 length:180 start_codon:yes stop_codon:yes gene_type:complete
MKENARNVINRAVTTPENLGYLAVRLFNPAYGSEELPPGRHQPYQPPPWGFFEINKTNC